MLLAGFLGGCATAGGSKGAADAGSPAEDAGSPVEDAGRGPDADAGVPVNADGSADASEVIEDSGALDASEQDADASDPLDAMPEDGSAGDASPGDAGADALADAEPEDASTDAEPPDATPAEAGPEDAGPPDGSEPVPDAGPAEDAGTQVDAAPEPSRCVPGLYRGTFEGELRYRLFGLAVTTFGIEGDIAVTIELDESGGDLQIRDGRIEGADEDGNPVKADVTGTMNCDTLQLENGKLENGLYVREAFDMEVMFEGVVEADYIPADVPRVKGTWSTEAGRESGDGTFEAVLTAVP